MIVGNGSTFLKKGELQKFMLKKRGLFIFQDKVNRVLKIKRKQADSLIILNDQMICFGDKKLDMSSSTIKEVRTKEAVRLCIKSNV